jgi:hypothetical protein
MQYVHDAVCLPAECRRFRAPHLVRLEGRQLPGHVLEQRLVHLLLLGLLGLLLHVAWLGEGPGVPEGRALVFGGGCARRAGCGGAAVAAGVALQQQRGPRVSGRGSGLALRLVLLLQLVVRVAAAPFQPGHVALPAREQRHACDVSAAGANGYAACAVTSGIKRAAHQEAAWRGEKAATGWRAWQPSSLPWLLLLRPSVAALPPALMELLAKAGLAGRDLEPACGTLICVGGRWNALHS